MAIPDIEVFMMAGTKKKTLDLARGLRISTHETLGESDPFSKVAKPTRKGRVCYVFNTEGLGKAVREITHHIVKDYIPGTWGIASGVTAQQVGSDHDLSSTGLIPLLTSLSEGNQFAGDMARH